MVADAQRIAFAAAHLAPGSAPQGWWHSIGANKPTSWHDFERQLRAEFQPVQAADAARVRLDGFHQGRSQATTDYVVEFRRLMILVPDMAPADRRHRFVSGLRPSLAKLVLAQAPDTGLVTKRRSTPHSLAPASPSPSLPLASSLPPITPSISRLAFAQVVKVAQLTQTAESDHPL
jgi:hypothetical protein